MGHLVFKVLFTLTESFGSLVPSLPADRGITPSEFRQKTFLINWSPNCVAGLNLCLDNLIALLHLNLYFFPSTLRSVGIQKRSLVRG